MHSSDKRANRKMATPQFAIQPPAPHTEPLSEAPGGWRSMLSDSQSMQSPAKQKAVLDHIKRKTAAPHPIELPPLSAIIAADKNPRASDVPLALKRSLRDEFAESKEQIAAGSTASTLYVHALNEAQQRALRGELGEHRRQSLAATANGWTSDSVTVAAKSEEQTKVAVSSPRSPSHSSSMVAPSKTQLHSLLAPISKPNIDLAAQRRDDSELYRPYVSQIEQLPLELFDVDEGDRTGEQWMEFGHSKYGDERLPAKSLLFDNKQYSWQPCRVIGYDSVNQLFTIHFQYPTLVKRVKRLSLLFDDEDPIKFQSRLERCRQLQSECKAVREYDSFVNRQSSTIFAPIEEEKLHGIIGKLMQTSDRLVMKRQSAVEKLLVEVKEDYNRAMKQSIVEEMRQSSNNQSVLESLRLPPPAPLRSVPYLAVIETPQPHLYPFSELLATVGGHHWSKHNESSQVMLTFHRSWHSLHSSCFYDLVFTATNTMFPMALNDFIVHQEQHFLSVRERCQNDWRALLINLIRDNLASIFNLFVNEIKQFERSELKRFLTVCGFMLREQLLMLVEQSLQSWMEAIKQYSTSVLTEQSLSLDHYLHDATVKYLAHVSPAIAYTQPLFIFQLSLLPSSQVVFLPPLQQLEPQLLTLLTLPHKLSSLTHIDSDVVPLMGLSNRQLIDDFTTNQIQPMMEEAKKITIAIVKENLILPQQLEKKYEPFALKLAVISSPKKFAQDWFAKVPVNAGNNDSSNGDDGESKPVKLVCSHTLEQTKLEIASYRALIRQITTTSPNIINFRLIRCDVSILKEALIRKCESIISAILVELHGSVVNDRQELVDEYHSIRARLSQPSSSVYEMAALKDYVGYIETDGLRLLNDMIENINAKLNVLQYFHFVIDANDFSQSMEIRRFPGQLQALIASIKSTIANDSRVFESQLQDEQQSLMMELESFNAEVENFAEFGMGTSAQMEQYASKVEMLGESLDKAEKQVKSFQERQSLFGSDPKDYAEVTAVRAKFVPYFELWSTTSAFNSNHSVWMSGPFSELDAESINNDCGQWVKTMHKLEKFFLNDESHRPARVATEMKIKLNEFKQYLPLITWLRSPGLRPRHWDRLQFLLNPNKLQGVNLIDQSELTLSQLLSLNLLQYKNEIEEICSAAQKEYGIELALEKMQKEWKTINFTFEPYKNTGTHTLKGADEILSVLDEQLQRTQSIKGSPYIKFFEARAKKWEARLQLISAIMEEWLTCQKTWQYLEPIFSSEDIMRQMPVEGRRFGVVDQYWRKTIDSALKISNILDFVSESEGVLKTLQESNKMLDLIGKHLNEYLETKRLAFPRFFFLSNDELLSILSQTKNAQAVQPHLSKCFDAMNALVFQGASDSAIITAMSSAEGEVIPFDASIDPNQGAKKGNVELWLKEVESAMIESLKTLMSNAMKSYEQSVREDWIRTQAGQIVLAVTSTYWTKEVTEALKSGKKGLQQYLLTLNAQLESLVNLVRRSDLSELNRLTLGALAVIDVHARDVVSKMIDENVSNDSEFEWLAQMRYYYDAESAIIKVKMVNTSLDYGYEYLGNTTRLVITPLTDRCYRTLMGAIHLHLGGAPEGPAGTGKTETVKDLAKSIAQMAIVFNCSDALNFKAMAKFFKGLCCSGAWACFDEFNRIDLEVLSVIAQQISSIQRAVQEKKSTFLFEGSNIPLIPTCNVFITMNPGYAGRSELPDNLKALFRSVAMMIPDYAMIAEIVLYSYGYSEARLLARKLVACLRLSSEQLSSQDHYDFGMRNVKSILSAAGAMKHAYPNEDEQWLTVQSIKNCNEPKFVSADLPLFHGIVQDLFPTVELKENPRDELIDEMKIQLANQRLQSPAPFLQKCVELYDTVLVRHGIMMVGKTMSGKSTAIKTVASSVTSLHASSTRGVFGAVDVAYINPKSVTVDELYGAENAGGEWIQGVVPVVMGSMVQDWQQSKHWKWLVFDGPVDAVWIENMNTVLDDNKKLCLASGEQIKLSPNMSMVFEVEDLAQASPATVSRCGMVYLEPAGLGVDSIIDTWLLSLDPVLHHYTSELKTLCSWLLAPSLTFMRLHCNLLLASGEMIMVANFTKLLSSMLDQVQKVMESQAELQAKLAAQSQSNDSETGADASKYSGDADYAVTNQRSIWIECLAVFSIVWSIGSNTDANGRTKFSAFFRDLISGQFDSAEHGMEVGKEHVHRKARLLFPLHSVSDSDTRRSVFDFTYDSSAHQWCYWLDGREPYAIPSGAKFTDIIVPTVDTVRNDAILDLLLTHRYHALMIGSTGTGKTTGAQSKLLTGLDRTIYSTLFLAFSARTEAGATQDLIDSKLERRRVGVMGPPGGKQCVIFIDDLNMPALDTYGAQPPIELLRQFMDYGGWYEKKAKTFRSIVDVTMLAAMGPPGGGRNPVTPRLTRHFYHLCCNAYDQQSLKLIFGTIMTSWLTAFPTAVSQYERSLVDATVQAYDTIQRELLPTPAKSHYTFNLRDVAKVFQGLMQVDEGSLTDGSELVRLWSHECTRVFCDRLIDSIDIQWFNTLINKHIKDTFSMELNQVFAASSRLLSAADTNTSRRQIFSDFGNAKASKKSYSEVKDVELLASTVENYLHEYNGLNTNGMNLVLFTEAIDHIARISRIIRQPLGNALLVGVGGSGRQSLTRLAAFIADYEFFQVSVTKSYGINEWREDLRSVMRKAGLNNKPMVFLFNEAQATSESFIEDINSILSNGEVPNLFAPEDLVPIVESLLPEARKVGKAENNATVFSFFVDRCRSNIHVVLCLSPIGAGFRNRLRQFPSLVNCCTIDWFHAWPTEALQQVATHFLRDVPLADSIKQGVVDVCVDMQERVNALSADYLASLKRYNYVTPTSYLELIKLFRNLFETTRSNIAAQEGKYKTGLTKLKDTEIQVKAMQVQLEALKPELIKSSAETEELIVTIASRSEQVAATRLTVGEEEKECNKQAEEATAIKNDCEDQLKEALPALAMAMNALRVLKKSALDELKAMKVPTAGVILTIEALCIMMSIEPKKVGGVGARVDDYWTPGKQKLLSDPQLFQKLQSYDKDHIPVHIIDKVRPYCKNPDFAPAKIAKASQAAEGFCKWVLAMEVYDRVAKQIEPKRKALEEAESKLAAAQSQLASKKAQLAEVEALLQDLNTQFELCNQKKLSLEFQVKECADRLDRAEKLLGGLSSEKVRWEERVTVLGADFINVVGNILLSSGVIAYLGVFTLPYREACVKQWLNLLNSKNIPCDANFSLSRILGDPMIIRQWGIWHLPKDSFSIDNAIILTKSLRWGLIIDPQEQASRWIKSMEDEKTHLKVLKQSDDNFGKVLSTAIQLGLPVLIENIGETLDPILEPVLLRQTFKQGNTTLIKLGAEAIPYHEDFRLYLTSKLPNPHYSPEISTKVTVINMMITPEGLEDQMLSSVVSHEEPELEAERSELIVKNAENARQLQLIENKILEKLNESSGNILDDQDLIETLQKSKQAAKLIEKRVAAAAKAEENINKTRMNYSEVAFSSANLFFCVSDLAALDPMYQYSLAWFSTLFHRAMKESEKSLDVKVRTSNIEKQFLQVLYKNVCRSLFEKDKLLFSLMLTLRVAQGKSLISKEELRFLLTGGDPIVEGKTFVDNLTTMASTEDEEEDHDEDEDEDDDDSDKPSSAPAADTATTAAVTSGIADVSDHWLTDAQWHSLTQLEQFPLFKGLSAHIAKNQNRWRSLYESSDPLARPFPHAYESLSLFHRLMIVRILRADKVISSVKHVVSGMLGPEFISPPPFDLQSAYHDSNACTPLIFVLSPGVDVATEVLKLATELSMNGSDKFFSISLGQGQGPLAEAAIREAIDKGSWVLLANCHLLQSWLPTLQKIIDELDPKTTNDKFRLWLTSMPCQQFPVAILQNGVKITNEPPKGIRANLVQSYRNFDDKMLEGSQKIEAFKRFYFGLSFFHAVIQERRGYGPIGFNRYYEFTESDLSISRTQIKQLLDTYPTIPYQAMQYLIGQLNYGGRVTDDWDRRTLTQILADFIAPSMLAPTVKIDSKGNYMVPAPNSDLAEYRSVIADMPGNDDSEIFGFHANVCITCAIKDANTMFQTLLTLQPSTSGGGGSTREEKIAKLAREIELSLPSLFNIEEASKTYPVSYSESMNTVLVQELIRFNKLLARVLTSLKQVQQAIAGTVVMSSELEQTCQSLYDNIVPSMWSAVSYPSLKPLGAWVSDFKRRLAMFQSWLDSGAPSVFWLSGFFFTQSFLTGAMQNYARKHRIPIDECAFEFEVRPDLPLPTSSSTTVVHPPDDGVYVYGLYLEGARWDNDTCQLGEAHKGQLFCEVPVIHFRPVHVKDVKPAANKYTCPIYKTSKRAGTLSTTGHSTNFVLAIQLPTETNERHWVKRGVALLTQLDY